MNDLRIALRALLSKPAFTIAAILTLAIGIGANTAVFTVVKAVLLAPLPYAEPDEIVVLNEVTPAFPNPISVSYQNYVDWRDRNRSFETTAAFRTTQMTLSAAGRNTTAVAAKLSVCWRVKSRQRCCRCLAHRLRSVVASRAMTIVQARRASPS